MKRIRHKHPLAIRWFHWVNFPVLALMLWSGLLIYWANDIYRIGVGRHTLFHFVPDAWWEALGMGHRLAEGMAWHFTFMWLFVINGVAYVAFTLVSGQWRHLVPNRRSFREAWAVLLHDLHLSKTPPPTPRKYNGAQQIAYTGVVLMGASSLLTGLAIYKPVQFYWLAAALGGYEWARFEHFWLAALFVLFFLVHIAQVIRAGWGNFRGMISGYDTEAAPPAREAVDEPAP